MKQLGIIIFITSFVFYGVYCGGNLINDIINERLFGFLDCKNVDGDQICTDRETGLVWRKCSIGSLDDSGCSSTYSGEYYYCSSNTNACNGGANDGILDGGGTSQVYNECAAMNEGSGYANKEGWRVPTLDELQVFYKKWDRTFGRDADFADFLADVWTSTSYSLEEAYIVDYTDGSSSYKQKTGTEDVRCVTD